MHVSIFHFHVSYHGLAVLLLIRLDTEILNADMSFVLTAYKRKQVGY